MNQTALRRLTAQLSSRHVKLLACVALGAALMTAGCSKSSDTASSSGGTSSTTAPSGTPLTVGFIYVGTKDDYGYNQAMADGAAAVKQIPNVTVIEQEKVAETTNCEQVMSTMIDQGDAGMIFATSFGYFKPHVLAVAPKYPKAEFLHAGGLLSRMLEPSSLTSTSWNGAAEWRPARPRRVESSAM